MASGTCSPSKPMASARAAWAPISPSPVDSGVAAITMSMAETPWSACHGPTASRGSEAGSRSVVVDEDHRTGGHAHPAADQHVVDRFRLAGGSPPDQRGALGDVVHAVDVGLGQQPRSEEHTSELQSRGQLVCRLLLETKKRGEFIITFSKDY